MHDKCLGTGVDLRRGKTGKGFVFILLVDAGTMFDRDR